MVRCSQFSAVTADGREVRIVYEREFLQISSMDGSELVEGLGSLRTADGRSAVSFLGDDRYQIVQTGEIVRRQSALA
jgi:hypothetical protein